MSERLDSMEVFVAVVEAGNFAAAADKLKLTRSAVGKSVARLEARLDTRLFHRTTRSHRLTEPGQSYYERCRRALDELAAAGEELEAGRRDPVGRVRLTMPIIIGRLLIAPLLFDLGERHPQLSFDITYRDRRVDLIEEGIDLAIRSGALDDSTTLAARALGLRHMKTLWRSARRIVSWAMRAKAGGSPGALPLPTMQTSTSPLRSSRASSATR